MLHEDFDSEVYKGTIDRDMLLSFALLHCAKGNSADTAKIFYKILQSGGVAQQSWIAADDKDFDPCFDRMCYLASVGIMKYYAEIGGEELKYNFEELAQMKDAFEEVRDEWLDVVWETDSKLDCEVWLKRIQKKGSWLFDPELLRKKVVQTAKLEYRY